ARVLEQLSASDEDELCEAQPGRTQVDAALPLARLGRHREAFEAHQASYAQHRRDPLWTVHIGEHLLFLAVTGRLERAGQLVRAHAAWLDSAEDGLTVYELLLGLVAVAQAQTAAGHGAEKVGVAIPGGNRWHPFPALSDPTWAEAETRLTGVLGDLVERFDARDGFADHQPWAFRTLARLQQTPIRPESPVLPGVPLVTGVDPVVPSPADAPSSAGFALGDEWARTAHTGELPAVPEDWADFGRWVLADLEAPDVDRDVVILEALAGAFAGESVDELPPATQGAVLLRKVSLGRRLMDFPQTVAAVEQFGAWAQTQEGFGQLGDLLGWTVFGGDTPEFGSPAELVIDTIEEDQLHRHGQAGPYIAQILGELLPVLPDMEEPELLERALNLYSAAYPAAGTPLLPALRRLGYTGSLEELDAYWDALPAEERASVGAQVRYLMTRLRLVADDPEADLNARVELLQLAQAADLPIVQLVTAMSLNHSAEEGEEEAAAMGVDILTPVLATLESRWGPSVAVAALRTRLAQMMAVTDDLQGAVDTARPAIEVFLASENPRLAVDLLHEASDWSMGLSDPDSAAAYLLRVAEVQEAQEEPILQARALRMAARLLVTRPTAVTSGTGLEEALSLMRQSEELVEGTEDRPELGYSRDAEIGDVHDDYGYVKSGVLPLAETLSHWEYAHDCFLTAQMPYPAAVMLRHCAVSSAMDGQKKQAKGYISRLKSHIKAQPRELREQLEPMLQEVRENVEFFLDQG
ncbi:hypothetical protein, partial [Corynebacterium nasicanis]